MTEFKLYGKTLSIKDDIKSFAKSVDGFAKFSKVWIIVLTEAKTTKGRVKKIKAFAEDNNLKCYENKTDGTEYAQSHIGSFGSFL